MKVNNIKNIVSDLIRKHNPKNASDLYQYYTEYCQISSERGEAFCKESTFQRKCRLYFSRQKKGVYENVFSENDFLGNERIKVKETERSQDKMTMTLLARSEIKTVEDLLSYSEIKLEEGWEVFKIRANVWGNYTSPCYQIRVELKPIDKNEIQFDELKKELLESIKYHAINYKKPVYSKNKNKDKDCMLEIAIFDHHFGQLSFCNGIINYNVDISKQLMIDAIDYLLSQIDLDRIEKILFPLGQDFFNIDTPLYTTTAGTPQQDTPSWKFTFREGKELIVSILDRLRLLAPVDVIITPGNHDTSRSFYLGEVLDAWYSKDCSVNILNSLDTKDRFYYQYNNSLIGFMHKNSKIASPLQMALEVKELWSKCTYFEIQQGHLHHSKNIEYKLLEDENTIRVRTLPSLVSHSDWINKQGYKSLRESIAMLWHKDKGKIAEHYYHI